MRGFLSLSTNIIELTFAYHLVQQTPAFLVVSESTVEFFHFVELHFQSNRFAGVSLSHSNLPIEQVALSGMTHHWHWFESNFPILQMKFSVTWIANMSVLSVGFSPLFKLKSHFNYIRWMFHWIGGSLFIRCQWCSFHLGHYLSARRERERWRRQTLRIIEANNIWHTLGPIYSCSLYPPASLQNDIWPNRFDLLINLVY